MKNKHRFPENPASFLILFAFGILLTSSTFAEETLTWSSKNGYSFDGSFVAKDATTITLKSEDGRMVKVPLNILDEKSLLQLEKTHADASNDAPVFTYQNTFYRYAIYPRKDWLHLEFLRAGKPVNPTPYVFKVSLGEKIGRKRVTYKITGMDREPIESKDEVELRLTTNKGVILRLFAGKNTSSDFSFRFSTAESPENLDEVRLSNTLNFEPMLKYDIASKKYKGTLSETGYTFQELPSAFKANTIEYWKDKKSTKVGYYEKQFMMADFINYKKQFIDKIDRNLKK